LREDANYLEEEVNILSEEIYILEPEADRVAGVEEDLKEIAVEQNYNVEKLVSLVKENTFIMAEMKVCCLRLLECVHYHYASISRTISPLLMLSYNRII